MLSIYSIMGLQKVWLRDRDRQGNTWGNSQKITGSLGVKLSNEK